MDVSSANNLHKPIVSSAMSLINNKKRRGQGWTPGNLCLKITVPRKRIVVYKHIFNFLMENALIYTFQSGFLPGHYTTHQLIELINEIFMALDNREPCCINY
jgi:hypothetical protein